MDFLLKKIKVLLLTSLVICTSLFEINAQLLWYGDPDLGFKVFEGVEEWTGTANVEPDPTGLNGNVFHMNIWDADGKDRCEVKGFRVNGQNYRMTYGEEYYMGWRSMWRNIQPSPPQAWICLFQIHDYGCSGGGAPIVLRAMNDNMLHLQYDPPFENTASIHIWSIPFEPGEWHSYVIRFVYTRDESKAHFEFWYDGVKQTFINGKTFYPALIAQKESCDYMRQKWGIYRSGTHSGGGGDAYLCDTRLGKSYEAVAPPLREYVSDIKADLNSVNSLMLENFMVETIDTNKSIVSLLSESGSVKGNFIGTTGNYDVSLRYFDGTDGQSMIILKTGNTNKDTLVLSKDDNDWHIWTIEGVKLFKGDEIKFTVLKNNNENVRFDDLILSKAYARLGVGITEAEDMDFHFMMIEEDYFGTTAVKPSSSDNSGFLSGKFIGESSTYHVSVRYFDENDGIAGATLWINQDSISTASFSINNNKWNFWTVSDVQINSGDEIKIEAWRSTGEHCRINDIIISKDYIPSIPIAPSSLTARAESENRIVLNWKNNSNEGVKLLIQRSLNGSDWVLDSMINSTSTSFIDSDVRSGTLYFYRVASVNNFDIVFSNTTTARTPEIKTSIDNISIEANVIANSAIGMLGLKYQIHKETKITVSLFNAVGQILHSSYEGLLMPGTHSTTWDVSGMKNGLYFVKIDYGQNYQTFKIVKN